MKKVILFCLSFFMLFALCACGGKKGNDNENNFVPQGDDIIDPSEYENDVVTTKATLADLTIENTFISAKFNLDNGSLISLVNKKAGTDYLAESAGGNWSMVIDISTKNPFRTNYEGENAVLVSSRDQLVEYTLDKENDSAVATFTYNVEFKANGKTYTGIDVIEKVSLLKGTQEFTFDYEIKNNCSDEITICNFTGIQLSGLKDSANGTLNLFWPNKEGKIYEKAISKIMDTTKTSENLVNVYPGLCSMQLIQLYNDKESLYYYIKDNTREYKIANYGNFNYVGGYDYNGVSATDKLSLSFTQFPFIPSGETKNVFQSVVGVAVNESWYKGADRYQEFLYESDMINDYESFVENWNGFIALVGSNYGSKHFSSYVTSGVGEISYADWVAQADENSGVDTTLVLGWNQGGFDSMYPDYDFVEGEGFNGVEGFTEMAELVNANGDLFCCHMNSRIADMESNWSNTVIEELGLTNLQSAGVKTAGFASDTPASEYENYLICESYGSGTMYYVMSPAAKEFQDQLKAVVTRLRSAGCNGLWFDQLYERDAHLDYDESHKMSATSTPATLYGEGYQAIFTSFKEVATTINPTEPWIIVCGGAGGDYYAKWTDVYGGNWSRKLGAVDNITDNSIDGSGTENCDRHLMSPELVEYTVPAIYIGQAGAGTLAGQDDEFARAFVFGSPFLAEQFTKSTQALIDIYDFYPDIFYRGIYKDKKALQISDSDVIASVILSDSDKSFAIQLYNYDADASNNLSVYVSLAKLGITGEIESVTDLFTGKKLSFDNNVITLDLSACGFTSLYVKYK